MRVTLLTFIFCIAFATPSFAFNDNWREEAKALLKENKPQAALFLLEQTENDLRHLPNSVDKINHLRFLGELYWLAGKPERAQTYFSKAMQEALQIDSIWKQLSVVISVLELHRHTTKDIEKIEPLLQATLKAQLLPNMAKNKHATEIGRYARTFEGSSRATIAELLTQIRGLKNETVRTKALFALSKIAFSDDKSDYISFMQTPAFNAQPFEKLLWHAAIARLFDDSTTISKYREHKRQAEAQESLLDKEQKEKAVKILNTL